MSNSLRASLIRLAHENPSFRAHLLPLLKEAAPKTADLSLAINQIRLSYEGLMGTMQELGAYIEMEDARAIPTAREAARALAELSDDLRRGGVVYRRAGTEG